MWNQEKEKAMVFLSAKLGRWSQLLLDVGRPREEVCGHVNASPVRHPATSSRQWDQ